MDYVNSLISEWMPEKGKRVAVDSHPRLSGIMDTVNSTLAHGRRTRLPAKFYDPRGYEIMERIIMEEWFSGYKESREVRELGVGSLIGDIVARMVGYSAETLNGGCIKVEHVNGLKSRQNGEKAIKFAMSGCHDSTLAGILSSLGAFEGEKWPPYTSHIAIELFKREVNLDELVEGKVDHQRPAIAGTEQPQGPRPNNPSSHINGMASKGTARTNVEDLTPAEKRSLDGFYVRIRYNDRPIVMPGCKLPGNHLQGNESFCTLVRVL